MNIFKGFLIGLACIVGLFVTCWAFQGNDFFMAKVFMPQYEQVRRDTFKQSQAYNEGMAQDIYDMEKDYIKATDPVIKSGLKDLILHKVAGYELKMFPSDLRTFIINLKEE